MPKLALRRSLRLVGTGLPRLWAAARSTGASTSQSTDALLASALAFSRAAAESPRQWRRQNAVRHFIWQAYLAARHGETLARALGDAQEQGSGDQVDTRVDQENNALGRAWGLAHAEELRSGTRAEVLERLVAVADRKWHDEELSAAPLPDGSDPRRAPGRGSARRRRRSGARPPR
ncbi:DUF6973 domain-containing protein [Nocardioides campestrisoli]|uniref:DUF6973 domain-containing protein n=1 Tax=Nocardioides campestrisoli TaxID=2736757 RepID=UPI0015E7164D|nr:hypothetical protein [Nocardioides campestrisoli]